MEEQDQALTPKKRSYKKILLVLISIVLVIAVVSVGSYFLINNLNNQASTGAQNVTEEDGSELILEPTRTPSSKTKFICSDNKGVEAAFYNEGDFPSADIKLSDGTSVLLYKVESASGARYANSDESIVFFNSGNEGFVEENGKITYEDCIKSS